MADVDATSIVFDAHGVVMAADGAAAARAAGDAKHEGRWIGWALYHAHNLVDAGASPTVVRPLLHRLRSYTAEVRA